MQLGKITPLSDTLPANMCRHLHDVSKRHAVFRQYHLVNKLHVLCYRIILENAFQNSPLKVRLSCGWWLAEIQGSTWAPLLATNLLPHPLNTNSAWIRWKHNQHLGDSSASNDSGSSLLERNLVPAPLGSPQSAAGKRTLAGFVMGRRWMNSHSGQVAGDSEPYGYDGAPPWVPARDISFQRCWLSRWSHTLLASMDFNTPSRWGLWGAWHHQGATMEMREVRRRGQG